MNQTQYKVTLTGRNPLLMHRDNLAFGEKLKAWRAAPENKALSVGGDDRSPAWTWIGSLYHDGHVVGIESDNLMTMLREGGAKLKTGKGQETYKKQTQNGLCVDQPLWPVLVNGKGIPFDPMLALIGNNDFVQHMEVAEKLGFELFVKRAKIQASKHVRVRPLFRDWSVSGTITVFDEEISGLTESVLHTILNQAGMLCGLGDWRPSSGKSGTYGVFSATVEPVK